MFLAKLEFYHLSSPGLLEFISAETVRDDTSTGHPFVHWPEKAKTLMIFVHILLLLHALSPNIHLFSLFSVFLVTCHLFSFPHLITSQIHFFVQLCCPVSRLDSLVVLSLFHLFIYLFFLLVVVVVCHLQSLLSWNTALQWEKR